MFRVERTDTGLLVAPEGRLDSAAAEDFSEAVLAGVQEEYQTVVIDLASVTFVSSAGLRAFLIIARAHNGEVRLCCLRPDVRELFAISGFDHILGIYESHEEAVAGGAAPRQ